MTFLAHRSWVLLAGVVLLLLLASVLGVAPILFAHLPGHLAAGWSSTGIPGQIAANHQPSL